jgi:predicted flavoprotein YhiN
VNGQHFTHSFRCRPRAGSADVPIGCPLLLVAARSDILVIGAGAAGLFAATWAGRTAGAAGRPVSITALDTARKLGANILVAGGGRCNVTHQRVSEADYAGSSPAAIRKVLRRFTVADTVAFFRAAGVALKTEVTGKLFPTSDSARTVLDALVREATKAGGRLLHPARVTALAKPAAGRCPRAAPTARATAWPRASATR